MAENTEANDDEAVWERNELDGTDTWWNAFKTYLELPLSERSYAEVARRTGSNYDAVRLQALAAYWKERARAHDRHQDRLLTRWRLADQRAAIKRHQAAARGLLEVATIELGRLLEEVKQKGAVRRLKPSEIRDIVDTAIKLERLVDGEPTANLIVDNKNLEKLTDAELEAMRALVEKLG